MSVSKPIRRIRVSTKSSRRAPGVFEVDHPLIRHHLTRLRDERTDPSEFRTLIRRLASLLAYEATKDLIEEPLTVRTPIQETEGRRLRERIGLVPILRAGLGTVSYTHLTLPTNREV